MKTAHIESSFLLGGPYFDNFNDFDKVKNQTVTCRVWIEKPTIQTRVQLWLSNGKSLYGNWIQPGQSGYSTFTGYFDGSVGFSGWNLALKVEGGNNIADIRYKEVKLELEDHATPWSPAPEDLEVNDK